MLLNCGVGEDSWESLGQQDQTSQSLRKSTVNIHWKDWCWSWSSNSLAIWCKDLTHWKRPLCWERLKAGGGGGDREWDGWSDHRLNGHELEQSLGDSREQKGHKDLDTAQWLNSNNSKRKLSIIPLVNSAKSKDIVLLTSMIQWSQLHVWQWHSLGSYEWINGLGIVKN